MNSRMVAYAYPTSSTADQLKFHKGCYYSAEVTGEGMYQRKLNLRGFNSREEAITDALVRFPNHPWARYSLGKEQT